MGGRLPTVPYDHSAWPARVRGQLPSASPFLPGTCSQSVPTGISSVIPARTCTFHLLSSAHSIWSLGLEHTLTNVTPVGWKQEQKVQRLEVSICSSPGQPDTGASMRAGLVGSRMDGPGPVAGPWVPSEGSYLRTTRQTHTTEGPPTKQEARAS